MKQSDALAYLELKTAQNLFGKPPGELADAERARVHHLAARQYVLETRVLRTPEAHEASVSARHVQAALQEIRERYPDSEAFHADLACHHLDEARFLLALERDLKVEHVLEHIGKRAPRVAEIDVELYYHYHPEQFRRAETRHARHILVTINPDLPENTQHAARQRIEAIAARLDKNGKRFDEQARKHSECPTALQGGWLGEVKRGQLYPQLDFALFKMHAGDISTILESPLGYHLVQCETIQSARTLPLEEARPAIRNMLQQRRERTCQQAWIKQLPALA